MAQRFHLSSGMRYQASIRLGVFESLGASNDMITAKLVEAGFRDVRVWGNGRARTAVGVWMGVNQDVELPEQVSSISAMGMV